MSVGICSKLAPMNDGLNFFQPDEIHTPNLSWDMSVYGLVASTSWNPEKNHLEKYQVRCLELASALHLSAIAPRI